MSEGLIPLPDLRSWVGVELIHNTDGYVIWRTGTGDNVEITHIKAAVPGGGMRLFREFLVRLLDNPPYGGKGTVFGFTRVGNDRAKKFYRRAGFQLTTVKGVYAEGSAVVFSSCYTKLCCRHGVHK